MEIFPYEEFRGTARWRLLEDALGELVENRDLVEQTHRDYIVGYLCKKLSSNARQ
jgi:hypothetical protein